jgi:hypothetical protein
VASGNIGGADYRTMFGMDNEPRRLIAAACSLSSRIRCSLRRNAQSRQETH